MKRLVNACLRGSSSSPELDPVRDLNRALLPRSKRSDCSRSPVSPSSLKAHHTFRCLLLPKPSHKADCLHSWPVCQAGPRYIDRYSARRSKRQATATRPYRSSLAVNFVRTVLCGTGRQFRTCSTLCCFMQSQCLCISIERLYASSEQKSQAASTAKSVSIVSRASQGTEWSQTTPTSQ